MKNLFLKKNSEEIIQRINLLKADSKKVWGKMSVAQMLAHCNVTYQLVYENKKEKPKGLKKWLLKTFVKNTVVSAKPYLKNGRTGPDFLITNDRDFEKEKNLLILYVIKTQELGANYFHQKESHSFGLLTSTEWNTMFYKHLNHHLNQFGVY